MLPAVLEQSPLVLVATLNTPVRIDLARLVARRGMTALACFDGVVALASSQAQRGALCGAIIDPELPSLDGVDVARALIAETRDLAVFMLAAHSPQQRPGLTLDQLEAIDSWLQGFAPALAVEVGGPRPGRGLRVAARG
jgi:CheY-like chemotaxis protein